MKNFFRLAALAVMGAFAAGFVYAEDKPSATVNGTPIPQERVDLRTKMVISQQQGQTDSPELRKTVREDLINVELMAQEAAKKGLDKQSEAAQQLVLARQTALVGLLVQDYMKAHPITDEILAKEYEAVKTGLAGTKEYKVQHILLENESDANAIVEKLKKGGKNNTFDLLAHKSRDNNTKDRGGELGWIVAANIAANLKPFAEALVKMEKGQISEPVHSQIGWHVIKLGDVRDYKIPSLEELKPQLAQLLQQKAVKQLISELREKAKID